LAGALAASKLQIPIGHVEAGLRSFDRNMPEEINRVLTDHISTQLYAPTDQARAYLEAEGIREGVTVTGNTVVDAVYQNMEISEKKKETLSELGLTPGGYFLVTAHRQENVDVKHRLEGIMDGLSKIAEEYGLPILFPAHPRTKKMMDHFGLSIEGFKIIEPVGYLDFLQLEAKARLILSDSGGIQEEACILGVPCVTLRDNTERPETVNVGSNILAGTDPQTILAAAARMMKMGKDWVNPYGDGMSGQRIIKLASELSR